MKVGHGTRPCTARQSSENSGNSKGAPNLGLQAAKDFWGKSFAGAR